MTLPNVREQRQQARTAALRKAEQMDALCQAYDDWLDKIQSEQLEETSMRWHVQQELAALLRQAGARAEKEANEHRAKAERIGFTLALAARGSTED
jgi:crotonobetainyl-CoA:carnitine CoA-transferase CaiB-like acyl-CoA transferase